MSVRVCVLTSVHPPFDVRIFQKECLSLARAGFDVTLIAPHSRDRTRLNASISAPRSQAPDVMEGVHLLAVPRVRSRLARMTLTVWRIFREALRQNADVYHFHDPELIPAGLLLRAMGKTVVYDVHEDLPRVIPYKAYLPAWFSRIAAKVIEFFESSAANLFSGIIAATPAVAARFARFNRQTIAVNNFPSLQECASPRAWSRREPAIAFVSASITRARGACQMVEAMSLLPVDFHAKLDLVGAVDPPELARDLERTPGWSRVRFRGSNNRSDVWDLLGRVRAGIVVEHPLPNHLSGRPIKLFEYMAAGIPVIASDFPDWRRIICSEGCGLLVDPLDPAQIAGAMRYLLAHPRQAEAMGQRGWRAVRQRYNWEAEEKKLLAFYAQLVRSARAELVPRAAA